VNGWDLKRENSDLRRGQLLKKWRTGYGNGKIARQNGEAASAWATTTMKQRQEQLRGRGKLSNALQSGGGGWMMPVDDK